MLPGLWFAGRHIFGFYDHNESMYLMTAWRLAQGEVMYLDFAFLQGPIYPMVLAPFIVLLGNTVSLLAIGKAAALLIWTASTLVLVAAARKRGMPLYLSLLLALGFMLAYPQLRSFSEASNYGLPVLFFFLAAFRTESYLRGDRSPGLAFQSGLWLGLAIATKTYYAVFIPIAVLIFAHSPNMKRVLPLGLGGLLGALPLWLSLLLFPQQAWFGNVEFHQITTAWKSTFGSGNPMAGPDRWEYFLAFILRRDGWTFLAICILLMIPLLNKRLMAVAFSVFVVVLAGTTCWLMKPIFLQYLPLFFGTVLVVSISFYGLLPHAQQSWQRLLLAVFLVLGLLQPAAPWKKVQKSVGPFQELRLLRSQGGIDSALTLSPLMAHEMGFAGPPELSCGPFLVRIADRIPQQQRAELGIWTLNEMAQMVEQKRYKVVITGQEVLHESELERQLQAQGYASKSGPLYSKIWYLK